MFVENDITCCYLYDSFADSVIEDFYYRSIGWLYKEMKRGKERGRIRSRMRR